MEVGSNLILNDDFEGPPTVTHITGWDIFPDLFAGLGWRVEWVNSTTPFGGVARPAVANIEFHKNGNEPNTSDIPDGWVAHSGIQYIELDSDWNGHVGTLNNEPALARIYQNISTTAGKKYRVSYWHSYRPGQGLSENTVNLKIDGATVQTVNADGTGQSNTSWTFHSYDFVAAGATTKVEFEGAGTDNSLGIFLDDIALYELSCVTQIGDIACKLWELKDLGNGDIIWNFNDVKPGDSGRDVLSYHVYDNNAWMCTLLDREDVENVMVEPESPPDVEGPDGELSKYMEVFIWNDDGNGNYETGEAQIVNDTLNNLNGFPIAESPGSPVIASNTKYLGFAWCFGDLTANIDNPFTCNGTGNHNDAQTDILNETVSFYAEQARNNPNFKCSSVVVPD